MRAGRLDRKIDIERMQVTQDDFGQSIPTWVKIAERRSASVSPVRGEERFTAEQFAAKQQVDIRIRWSNALADLSPLDQIVYPSFPRDGTPPAEPPEHQIYDIIEVSELGRRRGFKIIAARRAETMQE